MSILWSLIVGGIIGWLASIVVGKKIPGCIIGNIIAGVIGSWLGTTLFGNFGPHFGGYYVLPSLVGAIIFVAIIGIISSFIKD
ncbi:MAG TPA: GlsB/YeaQ/YmgE family stress response membrane protein [Pseudogracilibacillus sp.]|nr:GlsB/YeaQ/YmgE family stress response membrane protein [Pseudogracilibacillus sp.]